jgi:hypothetical protein
LLKANRIYISGRLNLTYNIGTGIHHKFYGVCHHCFTNVYKIGKTQLYDIRGQIKQGYSDSNAGCRDYTTDGAGRESLKNNPHFIHSLIEFAKQRGITLDRYQLASLAVPNTPASLTCFAWLDDYFDLVGEVAPNGSDVELLPTPIDEIYDEYCYDLDAAGMKSQILSKSSLETLWKECFPNVKLMAYISVCGKCHTCAALGIARKTHKNRMEREHLKMLHSCHRMSFMNERRLYYSRKWKAIQEPKKFLSIITDGMAQAHCELPYYANVEQAESLTQHIQGVMVHGRFINIYRTFQNVYSAANMQMHTLLLALEDAYRTKDGIPPIVFIQIDGGPENISKAMIAMCELLVARGICKRIILSRLMVGHTHEDIDGRFAKIWTRVRNAYVLTMSQYKTNIKAALSREEMPCKVVDLFAIPDYDAFIRPSIDPNFGRYAKRRGEKDWSVLQFCFESTDGEDDMDNWFPLKVRTKWRPFAANSHIRLVKDSLSECGMTTDELSPITWCPEANDAKGKV